MLNHARKELAPFYPTYADFEPLDLKNPIPYEKQPMQLAPLKEDGSPDIDALDAQFSEKYLADKRNPRWVAKPTVACLWARTVKCKNCRATLSRFAFPFTWDFIEGVPLSKYSGGYLHSLEWIIKVIEHISATTIPKSVVGQVNKNVLQRKMYKNSS